MADEYKNSLIIFGYSEIVTLAILDNSKSYKVKEFNIKQSLIMYSILVVQEDLQSLEELCLT